MTIHGCNIHRPNNIFELQGLPHHQLPRLPQSRLPRRGRLPRLRPGPLRHHHRLRSRLARQLQNCTPALALAPWQSRYSLFTQLASFAPHPQRYDCGMRPLPAPWAPPPFPPHKRSAEKAVRKLHASASAGSLAEQACQFWHITLAQAKASQQAMAVHRSTRQVSASNQALG